MPRGNSTKGDVRALKAFLQSQPSLAPLAVPLRRAASSRAPILIRGEAGTGRSTLARALHRASGRAPLVESDVGLIPATLFEGELFGYLRGAFTGAASSRQGLVARADQGTLLLDRIEEIPIPLQPKLLRVLAENRFSPLGGRERGVDVRYISIATEKLEERMKNGLFREDLYYRLEVLSFVLPPLRQRPEDVDSLLGAMVEDVCVRYNHAETQLAEDSRRWILEYPWPGNLRELRNVLERAAVLHETGALVVQRPRSRGQQKPCSLAELEAKAILEALRYSGGHQGRAAELLGISRKTLWEKRKRYDIP